MVEHISRRIAVMCLGKIVAIADKAALFTPWQHLYTEALAWAETLFALSPGELDFELGLAVARDDP